MGIFGKPPENKPAEPAAARPRRRARSPPPRRRRPSAPRPRRPPRPSARSRHACVIGAKTTIKGEISGDEDVRRRGHRGGPDPHHAATCASARAAWSEARSPRSR